MFPCVSRLKMFPCVSDGRRDEQAPQVCPTDVVWPLRPSSEESEDVPGEIGGEGADEELRS